MLDKVYIFTIIQNLSLSFTKINLGVIAMKMPDVPQSNVIELRSSCNGNWAYLAPSLKSGQEGSDRKGYLATWTSSWVIIRTLKYIALNLIARCSRSADITKQNEFSIIVPPSIFG